MLRKIIDLVIAEMARRNHCGDDTSEVVLRAAFLQADPAVFVVECFCVHPLVLQEARYVDEKILTLGRRTHDVLADAGAPRDEMTALSRR